MSTNSNSWCVLPWVHVCVRPDEFIKPCCRFQAVHHIQELGTDLTAVASQGQAAMDSPYFTELRNDMLNDVKRVECTKCYTQESSGSRSMRQNMNNRYSSIHPNTVTDKFDSVRYIELSIDNICNLECKMCDNRYSTKLFNRDVFMKYEIHKKLEPNFKKFDTVDFSNLEYVKILGGEPFITPNFIKFIEYLIARTTPSNITIEIATNGTRIPNTNLIEKLNKFKHIDINVSLDGVDKSNDYQRMGSSYQQVLKNTIKYSKILTNAKVSIHSVVSILNANHFGNTIEELQNTYKFDVSVDFVRYPAHLSILYAPPEYIDWVIDQTKNNAVANKMIKDFLKNARYNPVYWEEFLDTLFKLDIYYNTDLKDFNPQLDNFLKNNYKS